MEYKSSRNVTFSQSKRSKTQEAAYCKSIYTVQYVMGSMSIHYMGLSECMDPKRIRSYVQYMYVT